MALRVQISAFLAALVLACAPARADQAGVNGLVAALAASLQSAIEAAPTGADQDDYEVALERVLFDEAADRDRALGALEEVAEVYAESPVVAAAIDAVSSRLVLRGERFGEVDEADVNGLGGGVAIAGVDDVVFLIDAAAADLGGSASQSDLETAIYDILVHYGVDGADAVEALGMVGARSDASMALISAVSAVARRFGGDATARSAALFSSAVVADVDETSEEAEETVDSSSDSETDDESSGAGTSDDDAPPPPVNDDLGGGSDYRVD